MATGSAVCHCSVSRVFSEGPPEPAGTAPSAALGRNGGCGAGRPDAATGCAPGQVGREGSRVVGESVPLERPLEPALAAMQLAGRIAQAGPDHADRATRRRKAAGTDDLDVEGVHLSSHFGVSRIWRTNTHNFRLFFGQQLGYISIGILDFPAPGTIR